MTYRKPKNLDPRITDEVYEHLMSIAAEESDAFISFGGPQLHFERAVLGAAQFVLKQIPNEPVEYPSSPQVTPELKAVNLLRRGILAMTGSARNGWADDVREFLTDYWPVGSEVKPRAGNKS